MYIVPRSKMFIPQVCALICLIIVYASAAQAMPRSYKELARIADTLTETSVTYGQIPSINEVRYLSVSDASMTMQDNEPIFIVFFPTGPRMYPQRILVWHEVINKVIDGEPYCITYAPITGSLAVYHAKIEGLSLVFDNEGSLYNNNSVLVDRNTGSKWLQILGMAFEGPLFGKGMPHVPAWWTTWGFAKKIYPDAKVMSIPLNTDKPYGRDPYGSYLRPGTYYDDERILYPLTVYDRRMHSKKRILGIEKDTFMLAVDIEAVKEKGAINFFMGPTPMVAVHDKRVDVVRVFDRTVWDDPLLFVVDDTNELRDVDTETLWSYDGVALEGNLKGARLVEILGINAFWFAWAAFNPETLVVPGPHDVPESALIKGTKGKPITP